MDLKEQLLAELKVLRQGSGLTAKRLDALPTLRHRVGGRPKEEAERRLKALVAMIGDAEERQAVAHAFGLTREKDRKLTMRRQKLARARDCSIKTVERDENAGLEDLAQIILEHSSEGDYEVPASQRIADLEMTVSVLARMVALLVDDIDAWHREGLQETVQADLDPYQVSRARVIWRGSDNGKAAVIELMRVADLDKLIGVEITEEEVLRYTRPARAWVEEDQSHIEDEEPTSSQ